MANRRIYYAIQQVRLGPTGTAGASGIYAVHGLQSAGIQTNFNLEQAFELGQLDIYQNIEGIPDVQITMNKVLDGYPLVYVLATEAGASGITGAVATDPTLTGRQNARVDFELSVHPDTQVSCSGTSISETNSIVRCSGMYVSSISYTFPVEGNFTEDVTLVGNSKVWAGAADVGEFDNNDDSPLADEGINRRQHLNMSACRFPSEIPGITESGTNPDNDAEGFGVHFQNVTVSCDLGREAIYELGRFAPYFRYATFPVEVTSEFEVLSTQGDGIQASEDGYWIVDGGVERPATAEDVGCVYRYNLRDQLVYLETCEGTKISLGNKNKLSSVNYTGGDTGGGNVTTTYSYSTFNNFTVAHSGGPLGGVGSWWDDVSASGYNPA